LKESIFKKFFDDSEANNFVSACDVIVHLAAMNRHNDPEVIYDTNVGLAAKLVLALGDQQ
jgi:UDP-2-acetamido-2,6-beta-L-arabino-hexul-4-ose reductase